MTGQTVHLSRSVDAHYSPDEGIWYLHDYYNHWTSPAYPTMDACVAAYQVKYEAR